MRKSPLLILLIGIIIISGCSNSELILEEEAERTAEDFALSWERKEWKNMYEFFVPDLKKMKNSDDFSLTMSYFEKGDIVVRLDRIRLDGEKAYAYYTASSSIFESKVPAMSMHRINEAWKFNAFANMFSIDIEQQIRDDIKKKYLDEFVPLIADIEEWYNFQLGPDKKYLRWECKDLSNKGIKLVNFIYGNTMIGIENFTVAYIDYTARSMEFCNCAYPSGSNYCKEESSSMSYQRGQVLKESEQLGPNFTELKNVIILN